MLNNEDTKKSCPEERYPVSPDRKHLTELVFETIIVRNGIPYHQKWLFKKEDFSCGRCANSQNTVFMTTPTGVVRSCTYCGFTEHVLPVNPDTGDEQAIMINEKVVSIDDAWAILKKHKVRHAPAGLTGPQGGRKRRIEQEE